MDAYKNIDLNPKPDKTQTFIAEIRTRMETLPPEQRQRFLKEISTAFRSRANAIKSDKRIQELLEETSITQGGLAYDLAPKYEEIEENQLLSYLRAGWKIEYKSANGKVIVKR